MARHRSLAAALACAALPAAAVAAPALQVVGQVEHSMSLSRAALEALPATTENAVFHTMHGEERHAWTGVTLIGLLEKAGLKNESGKNAQLRHSVLVHGKDGYVVAVAYGEMDPKAGNAAVLLAWKRDGQSLAGLQLVLPEDAGGARQVHDVETIEVR